MHIYLLTHANELKKSTATGPLVKDVLGSSCDVIVWERTNPTVLLRSLDPLNTMLVYPSSENHTVDDDKEISYQHIENFILLDGTWQEARKIFNRSPYLHTFQRLTIGTQKVSQYRLRRNQQSNGLCTAETVIEILDQCDELMLKQCLVKAFTLFNKK